MMKNKQIIKKIKYLFFCKLLDLCNWLIDILNIDENKYKEY